MDQEKRNPRHYIIVVHGIGEQKLNQTATEVVHRFAEVRTKQRSGENARFSNLLPAHLSAQSVRAGMGHGWSEFDGIPLPGEDTGLFDGKPATTNSGRNFRFVDLHWAHILQRQQKEYASPAELWSKALLDQLSRAQTAAPGWLPIWAEPLLKSVVSTAIPIKKILSLRRREMAKVLFDDFLGDVHLYGDYARTRGRAVRHFHVILDEILLRDFIDWCALDRDRGTAIPYEPPVFTVIAHSLGSIMSFDALLYAHARCEIRETARVAKHPCPSLPFVGYTYPVDAEKKSWKYIREHLKKTDRIDELIPALLRAEKPGAPPTPEAVQAHHLAGVADVDGPPVIPPLSWRGRVHHFVTLGSPIDKYLGIWFQNYYHMGLAREGFARPPDWEDYGENWLDEPERKILHYNLCDEQDPVGHHLDLALASDNYGKLFASPVPVPCRDVVFRRYAVPGLAHVKYWEDEELFEGLIAEVIEGKTQGYFLEPSFRDLEAARKKALTWAYFRVPLAAAAVTGLLLVYAWLGDVFIYRLAAGAAAILLWSCPRLGEEYAREAEPDTPLSSRRRWRFRRSLLAHVVAGMVEWRRILLRLSEGRHTEKAEAEKNNARLAFRKGGATTHTFRRKAIPRFAAAGALLLASIALMACGSRISDAFALPIRRIGEAGSILFATYLGTMCYVRHLYKKSKRGGE